MAIYTPQSISGYNSSPPSDDGTQSSDNEVTWSKHKTKLGDPIKTLAEGINTQLVSAFGKVFYGGGETTKSSNYTVAVGDRGKLINCTSNLTLAFPEAATAGGDFFVIVYANGANVVIDPNGSETVNGSATITVTSGTSVVLVCNGTSWKTILSVSLLDEDDMSSNSATQAPTQQSVKAYVDDASGYKLPLYVPLPWSGSTKPSNCLWLNGTSIGDVGSGADTEDADAEGYYNFIVAAGATYGNLGTEDFGSGDTLNVPDMCGRVIAGKDNMGGISSKNRLTDQSGGLDGDVLGDTGGSEQTTPTESTTASHDHSIRSYSGTSSGNGNIANNSSSTLQTESTENAGGGNAFNIVQPTIIQNYIVRYK